ncbi:MAG: hypothetical protein JO042_14750 [Sinobacteraceae bacterium]|nr:hypothetical protein [Nevskiaceae bacterium]
MSTINYIYFLYSVGLDGLMGGRMLGFSYVKSACAKLDRERAALVVALLACCLPMAIGQTAQIAAPANLPAAGNRGCL